MSSPLHQQLFLSYRTGSLDLSHHIPTLPKTKDFDPNFFCQLQSYFFAPLCLKLLKLRVHAPSRFPSSYLSLCLNSTTNLIPTTPLKLLSTANNPVVQFTRHLSVLTLLYLTGWYNTSNDSPPWNILLSLVSRKPTLFTSSDFTVRLSQVPSMHPSSSLQPPSYRTSLYLHSLP